MDCPLEDYYRVSEIQLSYVSKVKASDRPKITCSEDSHGILRQYWDDGKLDFIEQSKVLLLNRAHRVLGICDLSTGSTSSAAMDARMIFAAALKANASSIVLAHNHPSDSVEPSTADKTITRQIKEAGTLFGIAVLDHIILGRTCYYSFADEDQHFLSSIQPD